MQYECKPYTIRPVKAILIFKPKTSFGNKNYPFGNYLTPFILTALFIDCIGC